MKFAKLFLVLFVLFSWITHPIGGDFTGANVSNPIQRMTLGDIMGFMGLGIFILINLHKKLAVPEIFRYALLLLLLLAPGIFISHKSFTTFFEIFILSFLLCLGVSMYNLFKSDEGLLFFIKLITITTLIASVVGLYDLVAGNAGLPMFFKPRRFDADGVTDLGAALVGEAKSGFRNAGQAGSWILHMLTILLPLLFSELFRYFNARWRRIIKYTVFITVIFLFTTFKVASLIGVTIGGVLYAILQRKGKFVFGVALMVGLGVLLFPMTKTLAPKFYQRIDHKFATRITANVAAQEGSRDNVQSGFIKKNLSLSLLAFRDNPITGSGLGGFSGRYMKYEVHSSPFKIIGETGLLGIFGYLTFMVIILLYFLRAYRTRGYNPYKSLLINIFPFFVGCVVSWGYTWHMRKRSFWVMLIVIALADYLMKQWRFKQLNES